MVRETTLPNGLRIVTASLADARSVTVNIVAGTGSRFEDYERNGGVSHFLEHLLFKGSKKYPTAEDISMAVDEVGGFNNAYTTEDVTSYYIKVPAKFGALALDILTDMVKNPLIDAGELERERDVIVEEMNVFRDDPSRFIGTLVPSLIFPDNPLGKDIIGSEKVIRSIGRDEIMTYLHERYRPNNLVVAVAGAVDHDAVVEQLTRDLGDLEAGELAGVTPLVDGPDSDLVVSLEKPTAQAHFMVASRGYAYDHVDEPASRVVAAILGRGMSSRLFLNVRERQGLAYTVFAEVNPFVDTGLFEVYAGVNLDKIEQALDSVLHELAVVASELVGEAELAKAKQQLIAGLEMSLESNGNIADRIGTQMVLLGKVRPVEETIARVEAVTSADVLRVAGQMLEAKRLRFAIIAPEPAAAAAHFVESMNSKTKEK
jgi:predicted Zn-dependent peptidase